MKLTDIENGMMVEFRNGDKGIVINSKIYIKYSDEVYNIYLDYNDDFTHRLEYDEIRNKTKELDIVCIYRPKSKNFINDFLVSEESFREIWYEDDFSWNEVKRDSLLIIKRDEDEAPFYRYFDRYEDELIYAYPNGTTSITTQGNLEKYYKNEVQLAKAK